MKIKVKKRKENKQKLEKNPQPVLSFTLKFFSREATWLKNNHDSLKEHLKMKPTFFDLLSIHQFTAMDHEDNEDPYTHLSTFYELVRTIDFKSSNIWK